jgi:hypothetical protein
VVLLSLTWIVNHTINLINDISSLICYVRELWWFERIYGRAHMKEERNLMWEIIHFSGCIYTWFSQPIQINNCDFRWLYVSLKLRMNMKSLICIGWDLGGPHVQYNGTMGKMNNFSLLELIYLLWSCLLGAKNYFM